MIFGVLIDDIETRAPSSCSLAPGCDAFRLSAQTSTPMTGRSVGRRRGQENCALLAALALAPACTMPRQRIARLLWSDRDEAEARSSLRQALVALRKDLAGSGSKALSFGEERVKLDPATLEVDALVFARLAGADDIGRLRLAAALYRGELLADTEIKDREFEAWVAGERQRLTDLAVSVLDKLRVLESGAARLDVGRSLVALDPVREESHLKLMIALGEAGERVAALRQYDICRETLRAELDAVPGEEIEALRRRLLNGTMERVGSGREAISSTLTREFSSGILRRDQPRILRRELSTAVLPFDPMGDSARDFATASPRTSFRLARIKAIGWLPAIRC